MLKAEAAATTIQAGARCVTFSPLFHCSIISVFSDAPPKLLPVNERNILGRRARLEAERKRLKLIQQQREVERREKELAEHHLEMQSRRLPAKTIAKRLAQQQDRERPY